MKHIEIVNKRTGEKITKFEDADFEYVNPIKHYRDSFLIPQLILRQVPKDEISGKKPLSLRTKGIVREEMKDWQSLLDSIKSVEIPENLIKLLSSKRKKEQENLLSGVVLTPEILFHLSIYAYKELGYSLSQYKSEFTQKGLDESKMPFAYQVKKDGNVEHYGETELSDGQLKQALKHRKVKVAKFLDKGSTWHCFFTTYKSLRGEETWLGEKQPHFHYISNFYGIERAKVVEQIKSKKYKLGNSFHIKLEGYGNQPEDKNTDN